MGTEVPTCWWLYCVILLICSSLVAPELTNESFESNSIVKYSPEPEKRRELSFGEGDDEELKYIGCYDVWERSIGDYFGSYVFNNVTLKDCNAYLCASQDVRESPFFKCICVMS
jgi:hypothetical protein